MEKLSFLIAFPVLTILIICSQSTTFANINPNLTVDEESLLAFKSRITLDPFDRLTRNWSTSNKASFCFWIGVSCDANQRITALNLKSFNLEGTIAPHLGNLTFLRFLDLRNNSFSGTIPNNLCENLSELNVLALSSNSLSGMIPSNIYKCKSLEILSLSTNEFNGSIPKEIGELTMLKELYLGNNNLEGGIPVEIGNLSRIEILSASNNSISGEIPSAIFNLSSLILLQISSNNLSGSLPLDIHLPNLEKLNLQSNHLRGPIFPNLLNCKKVSSIIISGNEFTGTIPKQVGNLTRLKILGLGNNKMKGEIPSELGNLKLEGLYLPENGFTGSIPASIFNISTLTKLELSGNYFKGQLPRNMGTSLPDLEFLNLGNNNLTGTIPNTLNNSSKLTVMAIISNSFTGRVPNLGNLRLLQALFIGGNNLTGEMEFISSLTNSANLKLIEISLNQFKSILPSSLGNLSASLSILSAFGCQIKGPIPPTIGNLTGLTSLALDNNELTGLIPKTLGELAQIEQIYLEHNRLQGYIPIELCQLSRLRDLYLSDNMINGTIPACFGDLKFLSRVFLDSNRLTSVVPNLAYIDNLLELNLSTNFLRGNISSGIPNLRSLRNLDLSWNQFSGAIPSYIGNLQSLENLSFAHNNLQGSIPSSTGNLRGMESLDLSHNNISGAIPKSLESLVFLTYLNLSYNKLEGEIPVGGPFSNFTAQSFTMNYALCGDVRLEVPPCHAIRVDKSSSKHVSFITYILAPTISTILAVVFLIWLLKRRIASKKQDQVEISPLVSLRRISYQELLRATNDLSVANVIGRGSFGSVYKGTLSDGLSIAVKVFNMQFEGAIKSFEVECEVMSTIRHKNLVRVISCCSNANFKAIVLEYMPNGSLEKWLYSSNKSLDLLQRLNIAIDTALALEYLHHGSPSPIIHCDLKPNNILIDGDMTAHVGDFGISKLFGEGDPAFDQTITLATIGYMAPEYASEGKISTSCDVYSYGITLLELFTNKKPTDDMFTEEMNIKDWVSKALQENMVTEVAAAGLLDGDDQRASAKKLCVSSIFDLAMKCLAISPERRINMIEVVVILKKIKALFQTSTMQKKVRSL
ncbi:uncharacterized protein [Henckelia pumila]|uniref:uncharacterized protein n=1 Tax=Henckelia pumila TaxID=405737 RepID=UPI003C6DE8E0